MFGEPLMDMLRIHGDRFHDRLCEIRDSLASIVQNTQSEVTRNQWVKKSVEAGKKASQQLRNNEAYGWLIRDVAATTACEIFLNRESGEGFLCKLAAGERENVHWYVPPGSILFVKNLAEETGFVNMNLESLYVDTMKATTGSGDEHVDMVREPSVPSGHPIDSVRT